MPRLAQTDPPSNRTRTTTTNGPVAHHHQFVTGGRWTQNMPPVTHRAQLEPHYHLLRHATDTDTYITSGPLDSSGNPIAGPDQHTHEWSRRR